MIPLAFSQNQRAPVSASVALHRESVDADAQHYPYTNQSSHHSHGQAHVEIDRSDSMDVSLGSFPRRIQGKTRRNLRAVPNGEECREFQKRFFAKADVADISKDAGCTPRAAENIRDGENGIQMKFLVALCRNDPVFRAAFFELCGGKLQFPPEITAALAKVASWQENENAVRGIE